MNRYKFMHIYIYIYYLYTLNIFSFGGVPVGLRQGLRPPRLLVGALRISMGN